MGKALRGIQGLMLGLVLMLLGSCVAYNGVSGQTMGLAALGLLMMVLGVGLIALARPKRG